MLAHTLAELLQDMRVQVQLEASVSERALYTLAFYSMRR